MGGKALGPASVGDFEFCCKGSREMGVKVGVTSRGVTQRRSGCSLLKKYILERETNVGRKESCF